jgi:hypothetical protein
MKSRFSLAALAVLALALPAFARVLSYAPYSNTPAAPGLHARTSRYFALLEGPNEFSRQVVLYDSSEREEPRVVFPRPDAPDPTVPIFAVALYEPEGDALPMLLVAAWGGMHFSSDGGRTWTFVGSFYFDLYRSTWIDHGGLQTHPLWYPLQTGNDVHPFFVRSGSYLWSVDAKGTARTVALADSLVGTDLQRNRFLVRRGDSIDMVDVWGHRRKLFNVHPGARYEGWISASGHAYIVRYVGDVRFLYQYRNRNLYLLAGPYDLAPPLGYADWTGEERFFAVPTHDYEGAWMIRRQQGRPTTLSRHLDGGDVETMWSDPAGREVEALIPGQSGETLLIQVHVPRATASDTFVDPALAVWRVGDPMPTEFDELYLHEQPNKGFLHVDVDRMNDGAMFVFNSGITFGEQPSGGPISAPLPGGSDVFQEWGVVRASLKQKLVLPGVTRTSGANGSQWQTDVTIYNPLDVPQNVEVRYSGAGLDAAAQSSARLTQTLTLAPKELRYIRDVLNAMFLVAASGGSLVFTPDVGVNVFGRTYTVRQDGGTYGYGLHAIDFFNAAGPRFPLTFAGGYAGAGSRTNVMLTDTSGRGASAKISTQSLTTPAGATAQWMLPLRMPGALTIEPTRGTLIPMVVAIDNVTNDATYFPPDSAAPEERAIPMIVSDLKWTTDLYLHNQSIYDRVIRFVAWPWNGGAPLRTLYFLPRGESAHVQDVLKTWFRITGAATLHFVSDDDTGGEGIRLTSRIYATDQKTRGTYGMLMPPLNQFQRAQAGDTLSIMGISGGNAYTTNLTLSSLSALNATVELRILDDRGEELAAFSEEVPARGSVHLEDLFARRGLTTPRAARIEIEHLAGGPIGAFGALVDRITYDPTLLPASLSAK